MPRAPKPNPLAGPLRSLDEWSEITGVSQLTFRRMIARGELRAYRLGPRLVRVAEADMRAVLEEVNPAAYSLAHA